MLPHALAEQLIIHSNRSVSRTKHGLIAPRFAPNYVKNSIAYRGSVFWNAIGRSNVSILDCTDMKSFLKKVVKVAPSLIQAHLAETKLSSYLFCF